MLEYRHYDVGIFLSQVVAIQRDVEVVSTIKKSRDLLSTLSVYGSLLLLAAVGVLAAFQWHATLVYVGLRLVEKPAVNRMGWNTSTINGLSRFLYLVLGALWLSMVALLEPHLQDVRKQGRLSRRLVQLLIALGLLYAVSYVTLLVLS